jgi:hypothetical protein
MGLRGELVEPEDAVLYVKPTGAGDRTSWDLRINGEFVARPAASGQQCQFS